MKNNNINKVQVLLNNIQEQLNEAKTLLNGDVPPVPVVNDIFKSFGIVSPPKKQRKKRKPLSEEVKARMGMSKRKPFTLHVEEPNGDKSQFFFCGKSPSTDIGKKFGFSPTLLKSMSTNEGYTINKRYCNSRHPWEEGTNLKVTYTNE